MLKSVPSRAEIQLNIWIVHCRSSRNQLHGRPRVAGQSTFVSGDSSCYFDGWTSTRLYSWLRHHQALRRLRSVFLLLFLLLLFPSFAIGCGLGRRLVAWIPPRIGNHVSPPHTVLVLPEGIRKANLLMHSFMRSFIICYFCPRRNKFRRGL